LLASLPAAILAVMELGGCSSGGDLVQACTDYAQIDRLRQQRCYGVAPVDDESEVIDRQVEACVLSSHAAGSQVGASFWEDCAKTANNGCGGYQCIYSPGVRQAGEPCLMSLQCASLFCKGTAVRGADGAALPDAIQCGTCAARLPKGASCGVDDACEVGLSCFDGVCRERGGPGAPGHVWADCALPSWICKSDGFCGAVTPDGQPCGSSSDCATSTGCDVATKRCTPAVYQKPGAPCDGEVRRCEAGLCDKASGVCPTVLPDGTPCDPTGRATACDVYARCFDGICQIPDPATCK
jgi:hypothetical protein